MKCVFIRLTKFFSALKLLVGTNLWNRETSAHARSVLGEVG